MTSRIIARMRSLWRGVRRRSDVEADINDEFRLHIELRAQDLMRSGFTLEEAVRQARREFGSAERHKDEARRSRGLHRIDALRFSWLDVKLAVRMLVKHPGLTLAACLALAIGIPLGLIPLQITSALSVPPPFHDGERIVGIEYQNILIRNAQRHILHDYEMWRQELKSFERLAAYSLGVQNLVDTEGRAEQVPVATITASAFAILGVQPMLGRALLEADESRGAEPVAVLEHDFWRRRFGADARIVGTRIDLGATTRTIVGVMPAGFKFPNRNDKMWTPMQWRGIDYPRGAGPELKVFGRLKDGVSMKQAEAEVTQVWRRVAADERWRRLAADDPEVYKYLRPRVLPFTIAATELRPTPYIVFMLNLITLFLLTIACGNVGTLILARTVARSTEIAVRTALGADRGRIVSQLFVEALALAVTSATIGLVVMHLLLRRTEPLMGQMPAWIPAALTPTTLALGLVLAVYCATVAGVVPGLKATGKNVQMQLQHTTGGAAGLRFGIGATLLIVAEVALAVGFLSVVGTMAVNLIRDPSKSVGVAPEEYLVTELSLVTDFETNADVNTFARTEATRYTADLAEAVRRLESEPTVRGVALGSALPGTRHAEALVDVDHVPPPLGPHPGHIVKVGGIHPGFFKGLGQPIIQGRDFYAPDFIHDGGVTPVIVNRAFVANVLHGRSAVGRRFRNVRPFQRRDVWPEFEIVGVVTDLGMSVANQERAAGFYLPRRLGDIDPVQLAVRVPSGPSSFAQRLRDILAAVDPELMPKKIQPLAMRVSATLQEARLTSYGFAAMAFVALVLSVAALYALMSFTVSARTYEIAVRTALGARRRHVVRVVLQRALVQLGIGVAVGGVIGAELVRIDATNATNTHPGWTVIATVATVMVVVGALACISPTLRALRVDPIRALRAGL